MKKVAKVTINPYSFIMFEEKRHEY